MIQGRGEMPQSRVGTGYSGRGLAREVPVPYSGDHAIRQPLFRAWKACTRASVPCRNGGTMPRATVQQPHWRPRLVVVVQFSKEGQGAGVNDCVRPNAGSSRLVPPSGGQGAAD